MSPLQAEAGAETVAAGRWRLRLAWSTLLLLAALACALRLGTAWLELWPQALATLQDRLVAASVPAGPAPPVSPFQVVSEAAPAAPDAADGPEPAAGPPAQAAAGASAVADDQAIPLDPDLLQRVARELMDRRGRVEQREQSLATREAALAQVEKRLADYTRRLEQLKQDLTGLYAKASAEDEARLGQLVKLYEAMKAKTAAGIFDSMDLDLLVPVVRRMRDAKVAAIIDEMVPAKAQALTTELARSPALPTLEPENG